MANVVSSNVDYERVVVNTAPGAEGAFTNPVNQRTLKVSKLFLAVQGSGEFTPVLQFKLKGDSDFTDFVDGSELVPGTLKEVAADAAGLIWRAGIKQGGFTSGEAIISITW